MFLTSQILIIVGAAGVYSWLLTVSGTPQAAVNAAQAVASSQWSVLLMMNLVLLVAGCIMDPASAILLLTPLFVPICQAYGIDLIHFGIIMTMNLAIGMFTPPIGLNIFVTQALTKVPLSVLYPGLIPFTVVSLLALLLVTYIPGLSLWLARLA
jgi:C4-dicarboxylate transporter DctM subunit